MPEKDFAVGSVGLPSVGHISKKPAYLVILEEPAAGKSKASLRYFISLDKPDLLNGFIQMKGVYCDDSEDHITKNFSDIISSTPKESIMDIMFPWHKIHSIRSLVFNANKPSTLVK
jgi:hypothetical protein